MPGLNGHGEPPSQGSDRSNWRENVNIRLILPRPQPGRRVAANPLPEALPEQNIAPRPRPDQLQLPRIQGQGSLIIDIQDVLSELDYISDRALYAQRLARNILNNLEHRPAPHHRQEGPEN